MVLKLPYWKNRKIKLLCKYSFGVGCLKKVILFLFIVLFLVVTIVLISSNNRRIIGTWEAASMNIGVLESERAKVILTFKKDGTAIFKNYTVNENYVETNFTYDLQENALVILSANGDTFDDTDHTYFYSIEKGILTIKYGKQDFVFKKAN